MADFVTKIIDATFEQEVCGSSEPVLVDFWTETCPPCVAQAPIIEQLAHDYSGRVKVLSANVYETAKAASRYRLDSVPTLMLFKNCELLASLRGLQPKDKLAALLDSHLEA
jgi:thioredoxin 1